MSTGAQERTPNAGPSPIDFSLWLRTEACRLSREIDALRRRAGPPARTSYLEIRQRRPTECYCRQFLFFRSFYGSSEPGMPLNDHSIPSNPLRPLSLFIIPLDEQSLNGGFPRAKLTSHARTASGTAARKSGDRRSAGLRERLSFERRCETTGQTHETAPVRRLVSIRTTVSPRHQTDRASQAPARHCG